jgi:hypothetical protein
MTDRTVYLKSAPADRSTPYHTEEDCTGLQVADGYREVPLSVLNGHYDLCQRCATGKPDPTPTPNGEERVPSTPTTYKTETVVIGKVWTASRGFVDQD